MQEKSPQPRAAEILPTQRTAHEQSQQLNAGEIAPTQLQCATESHETHGALKSLQSVAKSEESRRAPHFERIRQVIHVE